MAHHPQKATSADSRAGFCVHAEGPTPLIEVTGEIDIGNVQTLEWCLSVFEPGDEVAIDLAGLRYIGVSGIAAFLHARNLGVPVTCLRPQPIVRRTFELSGVDSLLLKD